MTCRAPASGATCAGTQTGEVLTYDTEGRITAWQNALSNPTSTTTNRYDGAGNRAQQQVTNGAATTVIMCAGHMKESHTTARATTTTVTVY